MSGRRRHSRHVISNCEGTLRVFNEVTVQHGDNGNLLAIADRPHTHGEVLAMELMDGTRVRIPVRITGSRPILQSGSIRHQLLLVRFEDMRSTPAGDESEPPALVIG
jgi:hypothetical protein